MSDDVIKAVLLALACPLVMPVIIKEQGMYEALYVGYDDGGIQDEAVITVMRKNLNGSVEAVKILIGKEAESLHKVLTEQTVNFTIKEQEHEV